MRKGKIPLFPFPVYLMGHRKSRQDFVRPYQKSQIETMGKGVGCQEREHVCIQGLISKNQKSPIQFALLHASRGFRSHLSWIFDFGSWIRFRQKKSRLTGRVKEGRKGLPLPATGDEKGAFVLYIAMGVPTFKIKGNLLILKAYL